MTLAAPTAAPTSRATPAARRLSPALALLHPVWWLALGVLALNDHFLKGADLLPGWMTGKLSDLAGLFLAPPLLAALLRVRSARGLAACYGATGLVFSGIQLSAAASAYWVGLMGSVGASWQVWSDPSDLLALPMLWLSWRALTPWMSPRPLDARPSLPPLSAAWRHAAQGLAVASGALLCMATSPPPGPEVGPPVPNQVIVWDTIDGAVFVRNDTPAEVAVRVRSLADASAPLDCDALLQDPGALIRPEAMRAATTWRMPADSNMPLDLGQGGNASKGCYAVLLEGDAFSPRVLMLPASSLSVVTAPGGGATPARPTVVISTQPDGRLSLSGVNGISLHIPAGRPDPAELAPECLPQPDDGRLAWSDPPWAREPFVIADASPGIDGCLAISLKPLSAEQPLKNLWYVCMPLEDWPFSVGDQITPNRWVSTDNQSQALVVERIGLASGEPLTSSLVLTLNAGHSSTLALSGGATVSVSPQPSCDALADDCGSVQQAAQVTLTQGAERMTLRAGERGVLAAGGDATIAVTAVHAQHRLLTHGGCSLGPDRSSEDVELVIIQRAPISPAPSP
jgi:hypothetical protein